MNMKRNVFAVALLALIMTLFITLPSLANIKKLRLEIDRNYMESSIDKRPEQLKQIRIEKLNKEIRDLAKDQSLRQHSFELDTVDYGSFDFFHYRLAYGGSYASIVEFLGLIKELEGVAIELLRIEKAEESSPINEESILFLEITFTGVS